MAAAKGRAPKVYWAEVDGLNEWIVAAPNRPDALAALDIHQDLFAQGLAGEETDPDKIAQARARPCTALRRPKGSNDRFSPAAGGADWSAAVPKGAKAKARPKTPDRRALDEAEARLQRIEEEHRRALDEIEADRARLDERAAQEAQRYEAGRSEAETDRDKAARAFKDAGG